jgi:NO-binding membrane sensor protein with MHYT domain/two-component sensor histidine kinase
MHATHHPIFVILSLAVAMLGSWTALDLFRRVRANQGRSRMVWLSIAAVAMGLSIWSMHFVAMLGFDPGSAVSYDPFLTLVSLVLAIGATGGAFFFASREGTGLATIVAAGTSMGVGICLMHYVGMAALMTAVSMGYDPKLVALSLVIAVAASIAALVAAGRDRSAPWRVGAAVSLGLAIVGMHYTAMAALDLEVAGSGHMGHGSVGGTPPFVLAVAVAAGTLMILLLALLASLHDQRTNVMSAMEAGGVGYWEFDIRTGVLRVSRRGREILDISDDGRPLHQQVLDRLHPDERERRDGLFEAAVAMGADYDAEYRLAGGDRWVNIRGRGEGRSQGRSNKISGVVLDVTDRHHAFAAVAESERQQRVLIDELNHRVKNTLATIMSISAQTGKGCTTMQDFQRNFEARLRALSATHDTLTSSNWKKADLRDLFVHELKPYSDERFRLDGPAVELNPKDALALGMVFHELATNAAKYGALSAPGGCVAVSWNTRSDVDDTRPVLAIEWNERGGPAVVAPSRRGFGTRLICVSTERIGGHTLMRYDPEGFSCSIEMPISRMAVQEAA